MRRFPFGLINSKTSKKDNPINFSTLGIGAHRANIRNRVSRNVYVVNRGVNITGGTITPGIQTILDTSATLLINEDQHSETFTVKLDRPTLNLTAVDLKVLDTTEAKVTPSRLEFNTSNWDTPQTVTVTGVDDTIYDKTINTQLSISVVYGNDTKYLNIANEDNELQEVIVTGIVNSTINTNEGVNTTQTVNLTLKYEPTEIVVFNVVSDSPHVIVDPNDHVITFTPENWNVEQQLSLTITKADDNVAGGDVIAQVLMTNNDTDNLIAKNITIFIVDDDVLAPNLYFANNFFYEDGSITVDVSLNAEPVSDVSLSIVPIDVARLTTTPSLLEFSTANWNVSQQFTINGVNNGIFNPPEQLDVSLAFTSGGDGNISYDRQEQLTFTVYDASKALFVESSSLTINEGAGYSYDISLSTRPANTAIVSFFVNGSEIQAMSDISFDSTNWNISKTVSIVANTSPYAVDQNDSLTINSTEGFGSVTIPITITNVNETANFTLSTTDLGINEGSTGTFTIALDSKPVSDVSLSLTLNDTTNFSLDKTTVTFAADTVAGTTETITVTAATNETNEGNITSTIDIAIGAGSSAEYSGVASQSINITHVDNDVVA